MKKRLPNIELLRILSMLMILELHLLVFSGILNMDDYFSAKATFIWLMESLSFVAVNCYVLISGYFLVDSNFKIKRIINIYLSLLFYSIIIYILLLCFHKIDFSYNSLFKCFFPFIFNKYWFCTMYIMLYLLSPFLNKLINNLNKKQYTYLIIIVFIFYSIWSTFLSPEATINYGGGYSISWFMCLYLIAGYIKKFYANITDKKYIYIFLYLFFSFLNTFIFFVIKKYNIHFLQPNFLYNYYSITVLIASISIFMFFKNIEIKNKISNSIINFFAPTTFGIYLIHENPDIRYLLWDRFSFLKELSCIKMSLLIIFIPLALFIIFALLDKIRLIIFKLLSNISLINIINSKVNENKTIKKLEDSLCQK